MSTEQEIADLCEKIGLTIESSHAFENPHWEAPTKGSLKVDFHHFEVRLQRDSWTFVTPYSVGPGVIEHWGRNESPAHVRVMFRNSNPRTVAFVDAMKVAAVQYRPSIADVLGSLMVDASAIDHITFEDWADNFGYDLDSRKAERTYNVCRETGARLVEMLGEHFGPLQELASEL